MNTLLWFQRELRIDDNPCLQWALEQQQPVVAVYIHSPEEDAPWSEGAASRWWLHNSLNKLSEQLGELNINLYYYKDDSVKVFNTLFKSNEFNAITWGNRIEPFRRGYETEIEQLAAKNNIQVKRFSHDLLINKDAFLTTSQRTPYKVFTPFYNKLRSELDINALSKSKYRIDKAKPCSQIVSLKDACSLNDMQLLDAHAWHEKLHRYWMPGESSALDQLDHFLNDGLSQYSHERDYPAVEGTSRLSPHLHFGEISPNQIVTQLLPSLYEMDANSHNSAEAFLRQLIWREFARYILWHFPHSIDQPMNPKFKISFWKANASRLKKWQLGETGIAIVDAGMKQLWETGSMHNRVRMLVASLLTKNMGIAWQQGAKWFWDTLVDADLANNSMGWQWVAGSGVDASPYFRIFNPETQAKKFDPQNVYTHRWLANSAPVKKAVVDLGSSRKLALQRYQTHIRTGEKTK